ncbi:MAG: hypothetical protein ACMUIS_11940 [bacterium]
MNKRHSTIMVMMFLFSLVCLPGYRPARGEVITETEKWQKLVEGASRQDIPDEDVSTILNIARQADAQGIPFEPLLNKALEGMAKRAPSSTIINVLEGMLHDFRMARTMLNQLGDPEKEPASQREQSLIVLGESISRGVSAQELEALSRYAPTPRSVNLANASQDLATFKGLGFSPAHAMEIVRTGLEHGIYTKPSRGIPLAVSKARERGISDEEIKDILLSNITSGRGMEEGLRRRQNHRRVRPSPMERGGQPGGGHRHRSPR